MSGRWGKKDYESSRRNEAFKVQKGNPFQGLVPQRTSAGDQVMECHQGIQRNNWSRWEPMQEEKQHDVTKFNNDLEQIDLRYGNVEDREQVHWAGQPLQEAQTYLPQIYPRDINVPAFAPPPGPSKTRLLDKVVEILGSAACVVLLLISCAVIAYALPDQTQPALRLLQQHSKPWVHLARELKEQYVGGQQQGGAYHTQDYLPYSERRPRDQETSVLPPQITTASSVNSTAESVQAYGEWKLDGRRGAWVPGDASREQGGGVAVIPRREPERLMDLEVLAKEGSNWRMDNRIRSNSRGDYREALLTAYQDKDQAHASNLLSMPSGEILCVWYSGQDGQTGNSIVISRLGKDSPQWTRAELITTDPQKVSINPVLYYDSKAEQLYIMYTVYEDVKIITGRRGKGVGKPTFVKRPGATEVKSLSTRYAAGQPFSWSDAVNIPYFGKGAQIRNHLLRGKNDDEWLLPIHYTPVAGTKSAFTGTPLDTNSGCVESQFSALARTFDDTSLWGVGNMTLAGECLVEPTVVRLRSGEMLGFFRDIQAGFIYRAESSDDGRSWSKAARTSLPNNNNAIQVIQLSSGNLLMAFNNMAGEKTATDYKMWPMSLALSTDNGVMWQVVRDIEETFDPLLEYSYPSVMQTKDHWIHLSYTWSYQQFSRICIRYVSFTEEWLMRHKWRNGYTKGLYLGGQSFEYTESFAHRPSDFDGLKDRT